MSKSDFIAGLIDTAGSRLVSVKFEKRDGTIRTLVFNPLDFNDVKGTGSPASPPNIFRVRETTKNQWRSFDAERVLNIKVNGNIHTFN